MKIIKKIIATSLLILLGIIGCAAHSPKIEVVLPESQLIRPEPVGTSKIEEKAKKATALLFGENYSGNMRFTCTATAFEQDKKNPKIYRFLTAAHCVAEDDVNKRRVILATNNWYLLVKDIKSKKFYPTKVVAVGYQSRGDDFAILEAELDITIPVIPLSEKNGILGESIFAISGPLGLGKQLFRGHVSSEEMNRPVIDNGLNWEGANLLQTSSGPGASGSSIISVQKGATVAVLVGRIGAGGSNSIVAIPISKFHNFSKSIEDGKYHWFYTKSKDGTCNEVLTGDIEMLTRIIKTCKKRMSYTYGDIKITEEE